MVLLLIACFHILMLPLCGTNGNSPSQYIVFKKVSVKMYGGIFLH